MEIASKAAGSGFLWYMRSGYEFASSGKRGLTDRMLNQATTLPTLSARSQAAIDALCERGCRHVRDIIDQLETGHQAIPELQQLSAAERIGVLNELKSIMAVYDQRCEK
jgi:hypothetical protein